MNTSIKKGISFGLTSGTITTLGLIVGLIASTGSLSVVISGILVIAIADALSDALGVHISEEAENQHTNKEIWEATISTFLAKFFFAITFIIPFLILPLFGAIIACMIWGFILISTASYFIAKQEDIRPLGVIGEHIAIAVLVILATHFIGSFIHNIF